MQGEFKESAGLTATKDMAGEQGGTWRSGAGLKYSGRYKVQADGDGLVLSPAPFLPGHWLGGLQAVWQSHQPPETGRERKHSSAEAREAHLGWAGQGGTLFIWRTPLTFPHRAGTDAQSLAASFSFETRNGSITHHPGHLSWSGDINLTVCHFPFGLGPVEAALETPSIKCS